jgi:hypothetical protein
MKRSAGVGWLTVQIRESSGRRLDAKLAEVVKRAHAFGLKAATIAQPAADVAIPRQTARVITLADDVVGTVTIADRPDQLHAFVTDIASLLGAGARFELSVDGVVRELGADAMAASSPK